MRRNSYSLPQAAHSLSKKIIEPALKRNAIVICDRFTDSTIAYQGYGRGLPLAYIRSVNDLATGGLIPDITFLIDIPINLAIHRRKGMGDDRMESESRLFFSHVADGYMALAQKHPDRIHVIDGADSMEDIHHTITRLVEYELGNDLRHAHRIKGGWSCREYPCRINCRRRRICLLAGWAVRSAGKLGGEKWRMANGECRMGFFIRHSCIRHSPFVNYFVTTTRSTSRSPLSVVVMSR